MCSRPYGTARDKETRFLIGEEVLCRDSAKETQYSGKMEPKWKGPYKIAAFQILFVMKHSH